MKVNNLVLMLSILAILTIIPIASACMSDIECPGQGNNICQSKQLSHYSCIDNSCQKSTETGTVECCSSYDCASDQTCDTRSYKCVGGSPYNQPLTQINQPSSNQDNTLTYVLVIAGAIIIGFIILAIVLSRRNKK